MLLATRSSSSFFLMAYELEDPLAALASSSARHSEMDLTLWKADSRVCTQRRSGDWFDERLGGDKRSSERERLTPMVNKAMAWLTLLKGETSTACRLTVPWDPIRVESSRGPVLTMASTKTCLSRGRVIGRWIVSHGRPGQLRPYEADERY